MKHSKKYKQKLKKRLLAIMSSIAVVLMLVSGMKLAGFSAPENISISKISKSIVGRFLGNTSESDATIQSVKINGESLSLQEGEYEYNINLPYTAEDMVTIDAEKANENQKIEGIGPFVLDSNNKYNAKVKVTAANGNTTNTYNFKITKASSNKLKSLVIAGTTISPVFNSDTTSYTATIKSNITSLDVSATAYDKNSVVTISGNKNLVVGTNTITVTVTNPNVANDLVYTITVTSKDSISNTYAYTGGAQSYTTPFSGTFKFELWGSSGYVNTTRPGGAYVKGNIDLKKNKTFYVYIGGSGKYGKSGTLAGGWNGGGSSYTYSDGNQGSGGGATDIRLVNGAWNNFDSLKSRIMVAGAAGGMTACGGPWGYGGTITSSNAYYTWNGRTYIAYGATQTGSGSGSNNYRGSFGKGADGGGHNRAGGGGGYYGGNVAGTDYGGNAGAGSGGSSFISGHSGCNAVSASSTSSKIVHTGQNVHYSGYKFTDTQMIAGNASMPNHAGTGNMTGNVGDGYAKITCIAQKEIVFPVKNIKTSTGTFNVPFTPDNKTYYVEMDSEEPYADVTVELADENAIIADGSETTIVTCVGTTEHTVKVTDPEGTEYEYKLIFVRKASSYPYLKSITIDGTEINGFQPQKLNYSITMPYSTENVNIDAIKARPQQVIDGLGTVEVDYNEKMANIKVTSEDGNRTATYSISIKKQATTKLKYCEIEGQNFANTFDKDVLNYDFEVTSGVVHLDITAIPYDSDARVAIKGAGYIREGQNTVTITVSKEGLEDTVYTILVTKPESNETQEFDFRYTGTVQQFIAPIRGYYQMECWGASGENICSTPGGIGKGAYTSGKILLEKGQVLYIYVGEKGQGGKYGTIRGGWNRRWFIIYI